jgi:hypothetical protein
MAAFLPPGASNIAMVNVVIAVIPYFESSFGQTCLASPAVVFMRLAPTSTAGVS